MTSNESSKASRKSRKLQQQQMSDESGDLPVLTKEETEIARFLRLKCANKAANLGGVKVDFFLANKLVDSLMESKWGPGTLESKKDDTKQPLLETRQACVKYMQRLMNKQLFYRATKIYKETTAAADKLDTPSNNPRKRKVNKDEAKSTPTPGSADELSPQQQPKEAKKKFKLELHTEQKFVDANEPYAWYYDPTSTNTYIIGGLLILGAIAICCFPLWPSQVREGVYYLSLAGVGFLGGIIGLAVFKYILFAFVWTVTVGNVKFWLFPNLTEDVGFFESFLPVYTCKTASKSKETVKAEEKKEVEAIVEDDTSADQVKPEEATKELDQENVTTSRELTESTVEIIRAGEAAEPNKLEKLQEDYDFELLDECDLDKDENENEEEQE